MAIRFDEENKCFILETEESSYQMQVSPLGHLLHLYYGRKVADVVKQRIEYRDRGFSGNPYEAGRDRTYSLDYLPLEYSSRGMGDYRTTSLDIRYSDGSRDSMLTYKSHEIFKGKYRLTSLPSLYEAEEDDQSIETLAIRMEDSQRRLEVILLYGVFPKEEVITRSVRIINHADTSLVLEKALTVCLDFMGEEFDLISFYGRHCMERQFQRNRIRHGQQSITSSRGASSHQYNPFAILADLRTTEDFGDCYGFHLAYSGNFLAQVELDQYDTIRYLMGIGTDGFAYPIGAKQSFETPEVIMSYSKGGLSGLSHQLHYILKTNMMRGAYQHQRRPLLINNWEGTYFAFDGNKLLDIARRASNVGIEMFVLDDGWFGKRDDDFSGLGDWQVNEEKLGMSFESLIAEMKKLGLKFGLWFEPEMINEDSNLYQLHPEWVLKIPERNPIRSRHQLVLNLANEEVVEYLYHSLSHILVNYDIDYIKWDFNRSLENVYSMKHSTQEQGKVSHDYILGLYRLLEQLHQNFPKLLVETCSGGGGRFDAGMLHYSSQIWLSDNTDAIDRLAIQEGSSYGYPISAMGSHISVVPNHQTGRSVPMETRKVVALSGSFGYELDLAVMEESEYKQIREQIDLFVKYYDIIQYGKYYRLVNKHQEKDYVAWMFVREDRNEALVNIVFLQSHGNPLTKYLRLKGLDPDKQYRFDNGTRLSGAQLMYAGIALPNLIGDYQSMQIHISL